VLTGLVLLLGAHCTDRMATHGGGASPGTGIGVQQDYAAPVAAYEEGTLARTGVDSPGSGDMGGVLTTCLVVIALVLTAIAGLRPAGLRIVMPLPTASCGTSALASTLRAPSLAELCVLRT